MTNAERQARHRQRNRTAIEELLAGYKDMIDRLEEQIRHMESWKNSGPGFGLFENSKNITDEAIADTKDQIAQLEAVIERHAPSSALG